MLEAVFPEEVFVGSGFGATLLIVAMPVFPSLPVRELKPRKAVRTSTNERATFDDFLAVSDAFL